MASLTSSLSERREAQPGDGLNDHLMAHHYLGGHQSPKPFPVRHVSARNAADVKLLPLSRQQ